MDCYDVLFPLAIGPLTYSCPDALKDHAKPGMLVSAPIRNRLVAGILLSRNTAPPEGQLKELAEIHGPSPALGKGLLRLFEWMAGYYLARPGVILKQTMPGEFFEKKKRRRTGKTKPLSEMDLGGAQVADETLRLITAAAGNNSYGGLLLHSPSALYENLLALKLAGELKNIIMLLPEITMADSLFGAVSRLYPERTCLLHSGLSGGRRSEALEGIAEGRYDIVIGTRMALFAPLKKAGLIMLLHEHSSFYKMEEGIRYHVRDVAVMRGYFENTAVLLCSVAPSVDSYFNALNGKYCLIQPENTQRRPKISVVDMRFSKKASNSLSKTALSRASSRLGAGKNVLFVVNRKGYAALICRECESTEDCPDCMIPMSMHRSSNTLQCRYCGKSSSIPLQCSRCRSVNLEPLGTGTERLQEELEKNLQIKAIRFDKDSFAKPEDMKQTLSMISETPASLVVGTKFLTTHLGINQSFSLVVVSNLDAELNFPDFRAIEKAYAELATLSEHVSTDGEMILQTRTPDNYLIKYFKSGDYASFVKEELRLRSTLSFPPYSRLLNISVRGKADTAKKIAASISRAYPEIEIMGPVESRDGKRRVQISILLKASDRLLLKKAAGEVLATYSQNRFVRIDLDVDPS